MGVRTASNPFELSMFQWLPYPSHQGGGGGGKQFIQRYGLSSTLNKDPSPKNLSIYTQKEQVWRNITKVGVVQILHDMHCCSPSAECITVHCIHQSLRYRLKQVIRFLKYWQLPHPQFPTTLTRSGFHSDSHIPQSCSLHVPTTTKSLVSIGQPIRSIVEMYGSCDLGSSPTITGSTK